MLSPTFFLLVLCGAGGHRRQVKIILGGEGDLCQIQFPLPYEAIIRSLDRWSVHAVMIVILLDSLTSALYANPWY
jgi:hypothetical protein